MELIYDLNQNSGAMPIRWCLNEQEQEKIVGNNITNLFVVIDIFYGKQDTYRYSSARTRTRWVVPIERYMKYVTFDRPGTVHVCTALVHPYYKDATDEQVDKMYSELTSRTDHGEFSAPLFQFSNQDGSEVQYAELRSDAEAACDCRILSISHDVVEVPDGHFAQPFTGALKWWVEWFPRNMIRRGLIDQCDQRRWALFAFSVQPIIFLVVMTISGGLFALNWIMATMTGLYFGVLLGYRGVNWSDLIRGDSTVSDVRLEVSQHGWSSRYNETQDGQPLPLWRQLAPPAALLLLLAIFSTPSAVSASSMSVWFMTSTAVLFALGFVGMFVMLQRYRRDLKSRREEAYARYGWKEERAARRAMEQKSEAKREVAAERMRQLVADLACPVSATQGNLNPKSVLNIAAIPAEHRTLQLRYDAIKARICRPLAR